MNSGIAGSDQAAIKGKQSGLRQPLEKRQQGRGLKVNKHGRVYLLSDGRHFGLERGRNAELLQWEREMKERLVGALKAVLASCPGEGICAGAIAGYVGGPILRQAFC